MLLPFFSTIGVVIAYTALYVVAFFPRLYPRGAAGFSHKGATAREQVEFSSGDAAGMKRMPALMR